jgi:peptidoglycan/xylan/chitin deacetylase (PgdA/CDA1 family)
MYDAAVFEFPLSAMPDLNVDGAKVIDEHNVEYNNFLRMSKVVRSPLRKMFYYREYSNTFREEVEICRSMDGILVTSASDGALLDRDVPEVSKYVVPNGVDTKYFVPSEQSPEPYSMIFTGRMDYLPNGDAMIYFLDMIFPRIKRVVPQAKIYIVGNNPPDVLKRRASNDVIITGFVDDVRPYAWKASVYVVPLRMGGGTRFKILEAFAMKKPLVTTQIGCEGLDVQGGIDVEIADDPIEFAEKTIELLLNKEKAEAFGSKGYELVKSRYNWDSIALQLDKSLRAVISRKNDITTLLQSILSDISDERKVKAEEETSAIEDRTIIKVLMYHRVVDDRRVRSTYPWSVSPSQFRKHLELLDRWGFTYLDFEDYSLIRKEGLQLPKKSVILTFDDGYNDIYERVLPILKEFGAKATLYVLGDRSIKTNVWDEPKGFIGTALMDDYRIKELHKSGLEIGAHSMSHPNLTKLPPDEAWREIVRSREVLEDLLQAPVISFAYPFSILNEGLKNMVQAAGYNYGCGAFSGPPKFAADLFDIRRIPITRSTNTINFAAKMLAPYEYYSWLRSEVAARLVHRTTMLNSWPKYTLLNEKSIDKL